MTAATLWLPDRYRLIERLGAGGMGEVWLADDLEEKRRVAVKRLARAGGGDDPEGDRIRFKREFLILSRLRIPGIVRVFDLGETETDHFYTMEHVTGWPLRDYFSGGHFRRAAQAREAPHYQEEPEALERIWSLGADLFGILARLHSQGLIHRDLKPANILVTAAGELRLIDFGLARRESGDAGITRAGEIIGTPTYLAPEQLRGLPLDGRADLYAAGVILYELAAGRPPFQGATLAEVLLAHLQQAPAPPRQLNPRVSPAHNGFILRLLAKEPGGRCATADEAAEALRACDSFSPDAETQSIEAPAAVTGPAGPLLAAPYTGNETARGALLEACRALLSGDGGVLLFAGPAGAGKSRLGDEARAFSAEFGMKYLSGAAHAGGAAPLQLWSGVFEQLAQEIQRDPARLEKWLGAEAAVLAARFPALRRVPALRQLPPPPPLAAEGERARLFAAVYSLFDTLSASHRIILRLDDLQWADELSLALVTHLLASFCGGGAGGQPQLAVIASYRDDEPGPDGAFARWEQAQRGPRLARHRLAPLTAEETGRLAQSLLGLGAPPPALFAARLLALTGGNPYLVTETLRALVQGGQLRRDAAQGWDFIGWAAAQHGVTAPENLSGAARGVLLHPLQRLEPAARDALVAAALIGPRFRFAWWRGCLEVTEDALVEIADQTIRAGLLREWGGDELAFSHELLRAALLNEVSGVRRRRMHGKIVAAIAADGPGREREELLAHHAIEAGLREVAVRYGHAATARLMDQGQHESAYQLLLRLDALHPLEAPMTPPQRLEQQRQMLSLRLFRGELAAAAAIAPEVCAAAREAGNRETEMKLWLIRAAIERRRGEAGASLASYRTAQELARAAGNPTVEAEALRGIGWLMIAGGQTAAAREQLEAAWAQIQATGDESRYRIILSTLAVLAYYTGDMRTTGELSRRCLELAQRHGDVAGEALETGNLGEVALQMGDLAEAERMLLRSAELNRAIGQRYVLPDNHLNLAQLHALRADWPTALRELDEVRRVGVEIGADQSAYEHLQRARIALWRGDPEGAAAAAATAGAEAARSSSRPAQARCAALDAELALHRGDAPATREATTRSLALAEGNFSATATLARAIAAAAAATAGEGCDDGLFTTALAEAEKCGMFELGFSVRLLHGRALIAAGRLAEAREAAVAAQALTRGRGMAALENEATRLLGQLQKKITQ